MIIVLSSFNKSAGGYAGRSAILYTTITNPPVVIVPVGAVSQTINQGQQVRTASDTPVHVAR